MTITHEAPAPARIRRSVPLAKLTGTQRALADHALAHLGVAGGVVEDEPAETDPATRALITWTVAAALGITVSPGHELAQCYGCRDVLDGAHVSETGGFLRCTDCRPYDGYDG
jgi:hypothetical protein